MYLSAAQAATRRTRAVGLESGGVDGWRSGSCPL